MRLSFASQWAKITEAWCARGKCGPRLPINIIRALHALGWRPPAAPAIEAAYLVEHRAPGAVLVLVAAMTRTSDEAIEWVRGQRPEVWADGYFAVYPQRFSRGPDDREDLPDPLQLRFFDAYGKELDEQPDLAVRS